MNIKVVLVPLADLKIRAEPAPTGDALFCQLRLFAAAEPAVVDDLWDHGVHLTSFSIGLLSHLITYDDARDDNKSNKKTGIGYLAQNTNPLNSTA